MEEEKESLNFLLSDYLPCDHCQHYPCDMEPCRILKAYNRDRDGWIHGYLNYLEKMNEY